MATAGQHEKHSVSSLSFGNPTSCASVFYTADGATVSPLFTSFPVFLILAKIVS